MESTLKLGAYEEVNNAIGEKMFSDNILDKKNNTIGIMWR
jgi:hypothetical protein